MEEIFLDEYRNDPLLVSLCKGPQNKAIMDYPFTPLRVVAEIIRNPKYLKAKTDEIRKHMDDKGMRDYLKSMLPYITFGGLTGYRKTEHVLRPTGLCMLDIDHMKSIEQAEELKRELAQDQDLKPKLLFISPSGLGVKALVIRALNPMLSIVEAQRNNQTFLNQVFNLHYAAKYGVMADNAGTDLVRGCNLCHDSNVIFQ